jgi:hypothetical protein
VDSEAEAELVLLWVVVEVVIAVVEVVTLIKPLRLTPPVVEDPGSQQMLLQLLPAMDNTKDPAHLAVQA